MKTIKDNLLCLFQKEVRHNRGVFYIRYPNSYVLGRRWPYSHQLSIKLNFIALDLIDKRLIIDPNTDRFWGR